MHLSVVLSLTKLFFLLLFVASFVAITLVREFVLLSSQSALFVFLKVYFFQSLAVGVSLIKFPIFCILSRSKKYERRFNRSKSLFITEPFPFRGDF